MSDPTQHHPDHQHPDQRPDERPRADESVGVPESALAAATRAHPSDTGRPAGTSVGPVRWVRAADAVSELSTRAAGHGIDLHSELARRARQAPTAVLRPATPERERGTGPTPRPTAPTREGRQFGFGR